MRGDKQVGLFDVIKNGYDKDDDLKDLEELMYCLLYTSDAADEL